MISREKVAEQQKNCQHAGLQSEMQYARAVHENGSENEEKLASPVTQQNAMIAQLEQQETDELALSRSKLLQCERELEQTKQNELRLAEKLRNLGYDPGT